MEVQVRIFPTWLAVAGLALANPGGPGESAVGFLETLRSGKLDLEPGGDTALAPSTGARKRQEISRRLKRLATDLGKEPLAIGPVRQEGDLAAALIRTTGGFDPARIQVFPVALVRRGAAWLAAPMPASFENSGLGYSGDQRRLIDSLESWMLRERVVFLEKLREQSADQLRRHIRSSITPEEIRSFTPAQVGQRFLAACAGQRLAEILGLLGGLSKDWPDQWPVILNAAETAIRSPANATRTWHLLTAPEVIRVPVFHEDLEDESTLTVACLDPSGRREKPASPVIEIIHLPIRKSGDGMWRVEPPTEPVADPDTEKPLLEMFPSKFALRHPMAPTSSATEVRDKLLAAFRSDDPATWAEIIRISGAPNQQMTACLRAAGLWWETRNPSNQVQPIALDFLETDSLAAAACQFFNPRHPDRTDIRFLIFEKTPAGWLWTPVASYTTAESIREWKDARLAGWQDGWQAQLLADCLQVDPIPEEAAPDVETSTRLMKDWIAALNRDDFRAALRLTARLGQPDSPAQLLRNLGYELASGRRGQSPPELLSIIPGKRIAAASTRTVSDSQTSFPLYPIVHTPAGPRILLEIDLIRSPNRSRDFLNRTALDRLRKQDPAAAEELAGHFSTHTDQTSSVPKF